MNSRLTTLKLSRANLGLCLFTVAGLTVGNGLAAQTLAMQKLQAKPYPAQQAVEVAIGCMALLPTPNQATGYFTTWQGPCQDGYAHGEGVKRIWALGAPLSASHGFFEQGRWTRMIVGYVVKMGMVLRQVQSSSTGLMEEKKVNPSEVPTWASDVSGQLSTSQQAWDAEVSRRLMEVAALKFKLGEVEGESASEDDQEFLFSGEGRTSSSEESSNPADARLTKE